jgi:diaminohydroxyphosphoribosylaminopyrimidine deaminase/5-amino-6-(5-phosphoribosylamino)uracil reductase
MPHHNYAGGVGVIHKYSKNDLMKAAIDEQRKCTDFPKVGAVIVKNGQIISTGYRGEVEKKHAERVAIEKLQISELRGSTLYTTLEPCVAIYGDQDMPSCVDLIIQSGITEVVIGVLDPNGNIYAQGQRRLLDHKISISHFNRKLRDVIEGQTFDYGNLHVMTGNGTRRVPVIGSGISIKIQFSEQDRRSVHISWSTLQSFSGCVDLHGPTDAVLIAEGVRKFADISDPTVFRFPSYYARMKEEMIAIVKSESEGFCVLIQLIKIFDRDIVFKIQLRNI